MFKGSNNVALGYDEGSILIKVCQLHARNFINNLTYYSHMYHAAFTYHGRFQEKSNNLIFCA